MNRPAPIHWALWQEAVEPSQSDPFPPQPQCEVHSPSRNKYGNIQEHRPQSHPKHFFFLHWVSTCRPDSGCRQPGRKKTLWSLLGEEFWGWILKLQVLCSKVHKVLVHWTGPIQLLLFPPTLDLWVPVQPCVCVCGWVSPLNHAHGQLLFSGSV